MKAQEGKDADNSDTAVAARAKRKARKELEAVTVRDLNWVNTWIGRLVALAFLGMVLMRHDFATAFGQGTGQNKVHLSPLGIVAWHTADNEWFNENAHFKVKKAVTKALSALAIPGEAYQEYTRKPTAAEKKAAKKKAAKKKRKKGQAAAEEEEPAARGGYAVWSKNAEKWVKKVQREKGVGSILKGNIFLGLGGLAVVLFALVSPLVPQANTLSAMGVAGIFVGLNSAGNSFAKPTDMAFYALVTLVAGTVIGGFFETDQKKLRKLAKKKARARKKARQFVEAPSVEEMAAATSKTRQ